MHLVGFHYKNTNVLIVGSLHDTVTMLAYMQLNSSMITAS